MDILIVEAGRGSLGFARFRKKGGALVFTGAERRPCGDPDAFGRLLRELAAAGERNERVLLSIDPEKLFSRILDLPIADRRKQREVLPLELKGETALPPEDLAFDALPLGGGKVMAIWGIAADLEAGIAAMKDAGLEPRVAGSSLYHWDLLLPKGSRTAALSDGRSLAVYSDGEPLLFRALGEGDYRLEISRTLALLEAGRGVRVERVLLHGPAASCSTLPSEPTGTDGPLFAPLPLDHALSDAFAGENTALEYAGAWAMAAASLKAEPVNFRHGRLAYTAGRERLRKKLRLTAILGGAALLLLVGETGLRYYFVKSDLASLDKSILQIYREVFPTRTKPVDEVAELKSEIRRLGGGSAGPGVLYALNLIAGAKGEGILGVYEAEIEGAQVLIKGDARSFQAVNDFKSSLSADFDPVDMAEVKSRPDGSVSFTFRGTLKEGGK